MNTFNFVGFAKNLNWNTKILVVGLSLLSGPFGVALADDQAETQKVAHSLVAPNDVILSPPTRSWYRWGDDVRLRYEAVEETLKTLELAMSEESQNPIELKNLLARGAFSQAEAKEIRALGEAYKRLYESFSEAQIKLQDYQREKFDAEGDLFEAFRAAEAIWVPKWSTISNLDQLNEDRWLKKNSMLLYRDLTDGILSKLSQIQSRLAYYEGLGTGRLEAKAFFESQSSTTESDDMIRRENQSPVQASLPKMMSLLI